MCVWNLLNVKIGQAFCFSLIASDQDHSVILTINSCSHFLLSAWVRGRVLLPPANPGSHQPTLQTGLLSPQTWPAAAALHPTASVHYNTSSTRPGHTGWTQTAQDVLTTAVAESPHTAQDLVTSAGAQSPPTAQDSVASAVVKSWQCKILSPLLEHSRDSTRFSGLSRSTVMTESSTATITDQMWNWQVTPHLYTCMKVSTGVGQMVAHATFSSSFGWTSGF